MKKIIAHPELYQHTILGCQGCKIKSVSGNTMFFYEGDALYRARLQNGVFSTACKPHSRVSMLGVVQDSVLVVDFYHVQKHWRIKLLVSLIACVAALAYCVRKLGPLLQNPLRAKKSGAMHA